MVSVPSASYRQSAMGSHNYSDSLQGQYRRKKYWRRGRGLLLALWPWKVTRPLCSSLILPLCKGTQQVWSKGWWGSPQQGKGLGRCEHRTLVRLDTVSTSVNLNLLLEFLVGVQPQPSLSLLSVPSAMALQGCLASLKLLLGTLVPSFPWWKNYCNWTEQPPSISALTNEWVTMNEKEEKPQMLRVV